jgi:N-acylneuraminate cytidylyltransferase
MAVLLTIIPARGGSKGIPLKNLQIINGKTLVERAIFSALKIPGNQIYVSSDSEEILELARDFGVYALKRSDANSSDDATSESVILESIPQINSSFELITLLQPTSPFIDVESWSSSIAEMNVNPEVGSMFSAVEKNDFLWECFEERWQPVNHKKDFRLPRQKKLRTVVETGAFYIFRRDLFEIEKTRFCGETVPVITKNWTSFDIDTVEDLNLCRELSVIFDAKRNQ